MTGNQLAQALIHVARTIEANKDYLCELDGQVGDGDHGVSMTIGMRTARKTLGELIEPLPTDAFRTMATAFADEVGASSGVLYEMGFEAAAQAVDGWPALTTSRHWEAVYSAIAQAIQKTGKAEVGDKTMLDAWQPAAEALARAAQDTPPVEALRLAADAAWHGVTATKNLIPKRGRASLLGERARGYQDAGATSAWLIMRSLQESVCTASLHPEVEGVFIPERRERLQRRLELLRPSALVWQAYAPFLAAGATQAQAADDLLTLGFFRSLEVSVIGDAAEWDHIAKSAAAANCEVMVWVSDIQAGEKLSLAALDKAERERSRKRFSELMKLSRAFGARSFGFCSPPNIPGAQRQDAIRHLGDGLAELAKEAEKEGIAIVFEALDHASHKKGLLGSSVELAHLAERVRQDAPSFGVCFDTAHAALNGENLQEAFRLLEPHVVNVHVSEAVLDKTLKQFGDWHMPVGEGDVMTPAAIKSLSAALKQHVHQHPRPMAIAIEEYNRNPLFSGATSLRRAWSYLERSL